MIMNEQQIKEQALKLIDFVSLAKDNQDYFMANSAFAVLMDNALDDVDGIYSFELETQDDLGEYPKQVYYDILKICVDDRSACIPVPLLDFYAMVSAMKTVTIVEPESHNREVAEGCVTKDDLATRLLGIVSARDIDSAGRLLADENEGEPFAVNIQEFWSARIPA